MTLRYLIFAIVLRWSADSFATDTSGWTKPFPPHRIAGSLFYVGSQDLASYLITTPEGHILINSSLEDSVPLIQASVEKLGLKFGDIKILLISHAHADHCAGSAEIVRQTKARYLVMEGDVEAVENGGAKNSRLAKAGYLQFPPAHVDRRLHDGDEVKLGGAALVARLTAGHTRGCTTWTMEVMEHGRPLHAVIIGSPNVNPDYVLVGNKDYSTIASDYEKTFRDLKAMPVDLFLGAHGSYYGMAAKHARLGSDGLNPFVDPAGYQAYVTEREQAFRAVLEKQRSK